METLKKLSTANSAEAEITSGPSDRPGEGYSREQQDHAEAPCRLNLIAQMWMDKGSGRTLKWA